MGLTEYVGHGCDHLCCDLGLTRQTVLVEHGRTEGTRFVATLIAHPVGLGRGQIVFTATGVTEYERLLEG